MITLLTHLFLSCFPQEDNEIPSSVLVKDSLKTPQPSQYDAESTLPTPSVTGSVDGTQGGGLQSINLSSDEDDVSAFPEGDSMLEGEDPLSPGTSHTFERRADRFKRSSLKKVDSLKKAFSRQSIEKKMTQISDKIVPPEKREKIKKSFTPNHPKSPTAKSSSFKVSPMTFNVKKVRDGEVPTQEMGSPEEEAHVEIPPLGSLDGETPLAEVHAQEGVFGELPETGGASTPDSIKAELAVNGEPTVIEYEMNGDRCAGLAVPENVEDVGEEEEEEEEEAKEKLERPVETEADTQIPTITMAVEQVS